MMEQLGLPPAGARLAPAREGPQAAGCGGARRQGQQSQAPAAPHLMVARTGVSPRGLCGLSTGRAHCWGGPCQRPSSAPAHLPSTVPLSVLCSAISRRLCGLFASSTLHCLPWLGWAASPPPRLPCSRPGVTRRWSATTQEATSASPSCASVTPAASTAVRTCPVKSNWRAFRPRVRLRPRRLRAWAPGGTGEARGRSPVGPSWSSPTGMEGPSDSFPFPSAERDRSALLFPPWSVRTDEPVLLGG